MITGYSHHAVVQADVGSVPSPAATSSTILQNEKLIQQIRQLEIANKDASSPWHYFIALAPTLAASAAILTFGLGWSTQRSESRRQKEQELSQRESESIREFDSRFASVVTNLGSNSISRQAIAASTLPIFLSPRYRNFGSHIIRVVSANLRLSLDKIVLDLLVDVLGAAIRFQYAGTDQEDSGDRVNLTDTYVRGLNITGARMREKFVADRADLTQGQLDRSDLWKAKLREATLTRASLRHANLGQSRLDRANVSYAIFHGCLASSASLRGIDGRFALFQGAHLQSAHLEDADLRGARFEGADLADCYFVRAQLDAGALQSILSSQRWRLAHFDPDIRRQLLANAST
jgi:Pentapeptide repeats (8 copies)